MKKITLFILFVTSALVCSAFGQQKKKDSLTSDNYRNRSILEHFLIQYDNPNNGLKEKIGISDSLILLCDRLGEFEQSVRFQEEKAHLHQQIGDYYSAFYTYKFLIHYLENETSDIKDRDSLLRQAYSQIILNASQAGLIDEGLNAAYTALEKFPEMPASELAKIYSNLGGLYMYAGKMDESYDCHRKALDYQKQSKDSGSILVYNNYAGWLFTQGEIDSALHYLLKAKYSLKSSQNKDSELYYHNLACIYYAMNRKDMAYYYFEKALNSIDSSSDRSFRRVQILMSLGDSYLKDSNFSRSRQYTLEALELAQKIGYRHIEYRARLQYAVILNKQGFYREAFDQLVQAGKQKDSVLSEENSEKIYQLRRDFEINKIQADLRLAELNNVKKRLTVAILAILTLFLTGVLIFLLYQLQKEKKNHRKINRNLSENARQLASDLEAKNQLIVSGAMDNSYKNEILHTIQSLTETLKKAIPNASKEELTKHCNDILRTIQSCQIENRWEAFRLEFESVYPDFYKTLEENVASLTKGEKRLAALLAAGLNAKEIAEIIHRTPASVETFIYRLRKKINIDRDVKTNEFFEEIKNKSRKRTESR